ncbi:lysis system o-spanin lipoprotein Rz1, partial [Xenorhabdus santafensis]
MPNLKSLSLAMICALTLSACMSGPSAQCLKPLPPPAWMVQDPP